MKEGRVITVELDQFVVINVYALTAQEKLTRLHTKTSSFFPLFIRHVNYVQSLFSGKHVFVCGDFNVALHEIDIYQSVSNINKSGFTKEERDGLAELHETNMVDTFRHMFPDSVHQYTYWNQRSGARNRNLGWRLDYILADKTLVETGRSLHAFILNDVYRSDHCPVGVHISFDNPI